MASTIRLHRYLPPCAASSLSASLSYGVNSRALSRLRPGAAQRYGAGNREVVLRVRCDRVIGIDLGTSNSAAAVVMGDGKPEIVPIDGGHATMPSWVHYSAQGARLASGVRNVGPTQCAASRPPSDTSGYRRRGDCGPGSAQEAAS
jgi:hypothetical protein